MQPSYPFWLANRPRTGSHELPVVDKFRGDVATRVALADPGAIEEAIEAAVAAAPALRRMPACDRAAVLYHCAGRFRERAEELAQTLCVEAGKPIRDSRGEVSR